MIEPLPSIALVVLGAILGAVFGSFIATLAIRWPIGRSVARGRSMCDACGAPIAVHGLVPIFGFLWLAGRARCCGARIDPVHLLAELLGALVGGLAFAIAPPLSAAVGAVFGWLLLALALLDMRHFWLPDRLIVPLAVTGLLAGLVGVDPPLIDRLIGGAAGLGVFALVRLGYHALRGREGMGGGDVKLLGAIGLWLGWQALPMLVLAAAMVGLAMAVGLALMGRRLSATSKIPFGVALAGVAWLIWAAMQLGAG